MRGDLIDKIAAIVVVLIITMCILHPSLWIGAIGTVIHIALVLFIARLVCRVIFKKSIREIIFGGDEE